MRLRILIKKNKYKSNLESSVMYPLREVLGFRDKPMEGVFLDGWDGGHIITYNIL